MYPLKLILNPNNINVFKKPKDIPTIIVLNIFHSDIILNYISLLLYNIFQHLLTYYICLYNN